MAEPQFKPARNSVDQFISDVQGKGILQTLNPNLKNDPVFQKVSSALDFIMPKPDDPLSVLGGGKVAAGFFSNMPLPLAKKIEATMKKIEDLQLKVKRERAALKSDGKPAGDALEKAESSLKAQNEKFDKLISGLPQNRFQGLESLVKDPSNIFHGSTTKGIPQLLLNPKGSSPGGLYFTDEFLDPRLRDYVFRPSEGAGSAYVVKPDFKNTVVAGNLDKKTDKLFRQMEKQLSKDGNFNEAAFQLGQTRAPILNQAPTGFTEKAGELLKDKGIDSIRYPTRRSNQSDTLVSVSPELNTKVLDELSLSELDELVRRLSRNK
tara:strand:- start:1835 stop:2797 length:963 start_codon:yes stop_codon:yes gene_type:complete